MAKKETVLKNELRTKEVNELLELLLANGYEDSKLIANNKITYPTLDSERNEYDIVITISIPSGQRGTNEIFDGQAEAEAFAEKQKEKARAEAERKAKAEKKAKRDAEMREKRKKLAEERGE